TVPEKAAKDSHRSVREGAAGPAEPVSEEPVFKAAAGPEPAAAPKAEGVPAEVKKDEPAPATAAPAAAPTETPTQDAAKPAEPAKPAIAANLAEADVPVAEKLREILTSKSDRFFGRKPDRAAVEAFYSARGYAPV